MGIFLIVFSLVGYNQVGKTDNIKVTIGESEKFSEKEINQTIDSVKIKFKGFTGCKLTDIWYDEKNQISLHKIIWNMEEVKKTILKKKM
ncbi:Uncharacterised protein [[Clostridium] sordellii]|uniref:Uncharacterized protein n=1 Tax=Paraclostridium sordellii TaxID=1505 RepID=A0ABM9RN48_PARSO|nr:hypothetical protein [Paeniclostridium sordellii]EPZ57211.1 hypothetical protein H477_2289 [[Clostridium] sordellii ATCC 9714] [Paeniclostridium sordellii ATCC 9714]CEJ73474.1 hypothetical protein ATCC9714_13621 [[Clostridium] sordellii] [Paeniclostridium sordellii]CEN69025.1 Uncharacterised protein [[Clostridium] sordellii] [Paeniclostridium sordellii]CEN72292.1 Uncharacterised protein [[Clostridium] sordellii] [Paeniclostridium sordellii]CEO23586.1 Uncharacterised protein [[Clostridium] s